MTATVSTLLIAVVIGVVIGVPYFTLWTWAFNKLNDAVARRTALKIGRLEAERDCPDARSCVTVDRDDLAHVLDGVADGSCTGPGCEPFDRLAEEIR